MQASIMNVVARTDIAEKQAVIVMDGLPVIGNPAILAAMMPQAVIHLEWLARLEGLEVDVETALEILRMDAFSPAIAEFLFQRPAGEFEPGVVEIVALAVLSARQTRFGKSFSILM